MIEKVLPRKSKKPIVRKKGLRSSTATKKPRKRANRASQSVSKLKKELDKWFSRYIRARDNHTCYTCGLQMEQNKSQNGHFVPRQYLAVRYDEKNCHCQCYACNVLYNGQPSAYALHLTLDFGRDIVEELESQRKVLTKLTPEWYLEKIEYYKNKVATVQPDV
jgi:hypothetical protein